MPDMCHIIRDNAFRRLAAVRMLQALREEVAACPDVAGPVPSPGRNILDAENALMWAGWYALDESSTREERLRVVEAAIASLERRDAP